MKARVRVDGSRGTLELNLRVLESCRVNTSGLNGAVENPNEERGKKLFW